MSDLEAASPANTTGAQTPIYEPQAAGAQVAAQPVAPQAASATPLVDLDDLDNVTASEHVHWFNFVDDDGKVTTIEFGVYGAESEIVTRRINELGNRRRKQEAVQAAKAAKTRSGQADYIPIEDDVAFGHKTTAARLAGWRGIKQEFTPELGLRLVQRNASAALQIRQHSDEMKNFTTALPTAD